MRAGWIWCDDFERNRLADYFEFDSAGGAFIREAGVGRGESFGMRARFGAGAVSAGSLKLAFGVTPSARMRPVDAGTERYRDIYWRFYLRHEPGWIGGGRKLTRVTSVVNERWAQAMIAHVWSGAPPRDAVLVIDPASGTDQRGALRTTRYNDFAHLRWLGSARSHTELFTSPRSAEWHCIEAHVRLDDAGRGNGVFELWQDGAPQAARRGVAFMSGFRQYGINMLILENYWNEGSPRRQERFFDDLVVGTRRIGC